MTFHQPGNQMRTRTRHCLLILAVMLGACARNPDPGEERSVIYRAESDLTIRVINHSQLDATLYIVHDGARDRLGLVTAATTSTFTVRSRMIGAAGEFSLLADPIGQTRSTQTQSLHTAEGSTFTWTLETDFSRGAIMVR